MNEESGHAYISPSNYKGEKCAASTSREALVDRRVRFLKSFVPYFSGLKEDTLKSEANKTLSPAEQGTALHKVYEKTLKGQDFSEAIAECIFPVPMMMQDALNDICESLKSELSTADKVDIEGKIENSDVDSWGFCDVWYTTAKCLHVRDLKTGRVFVTAQDNSQMKKYACGILDKLGWDKYDAVMLYIDAPMFESTEWRITTEKLKKWRDVDFRQFMLDGHSLTPKATTGEWCQHCTAKLYCQEFNEWVAPIVSGFDLGMENPTLEKLDDIKAKGPAIKKYLEEAEESLRQTLSTSFGSMSAYYLAPGRKVRKVKDIGKIEDVNILWAYVLMKPKAILTSKQLEKVLSEYPEVSEFASDFYGTANFESMLLRKIGGVGLNKSLIYKPETIKPKTELKVIFQDNLEALNTIESSKGVEELLEGLKKYVTNELMFDPRKYISGARLSKILGPTQRQEHIEEIFGRSIVKAKIK